MREPVYSADATFMRLMMRSGYYKKRAKASMIMDFSITEPCKICGKTFRVDYFGLCMDCADNESVSEFFIEDTVRFIANLNRLVLAGVVEKKDIQTWMKARLERPDLPEKYLAAIAAIMKAF